LFEVPRSAAFVTQRGIDPGALVERLRLLPTGALHIE